MIQNDEDLAQTLQQIATLYSALRAMKQDVLDKNPRLFALMAEGTTETLKTLQQEVNEYTGHAAAIENEAEIWICVRGPNLEWPSSPSSIVIAFLDALRKGVQVSAELTSRGKYTASALRKMCDMKVVAMLPGSLRVGVRIPQEDILRAEHALVEKSVVNLFEVAAWVGSHEPEEKLESKVRDRRKRRLLLNALKPLIPRDPNTVAAVEISGRLVQVGSEISAVVLTQKSNERINHAIDNTTQSKTVSFSGQLREIDLDKMSCILRSDSEGSMRCIFDDEPLFSQAKGALDKKVIVAGTKSTRGKIDSPLHVTRLEVSGSKNE